MKTIVLHGFLAEKYGAEFQLAVNTPAEAIRALSCQLPGFLEDIREGAYRIVRGSLELAADDLHIGIGKILHIIPAAAGAKRGGIGKAILGIAIVAAAWWAAPAVVGTGAAATGGFAASAIGGITYGNIALFGAGLAVSGIGQMLSPVPKVGGYAARERPDERPSFLFNGPVNTVEQGQPVPLIYGEVFTGSVVVSGSLSVEQLDVNA